MAGSADDETMLPRTVLIAAFDGVQSLDVTGPLEVFAAAQRLIETTSRRERGYDVLTLDRTTEHAYKVTNCEVIRIGYP